MHYILRRFIWVGVASCLLIPGAMAATKKAAAINIGVIYSTSGSQSPLDKPSLQGAQLAVNQINRAGGVLNRPLHLVVTNGASSTKVVSAMAKSLTRNKNINVLMGLSDDNLLKAAMPAVKAAAKLFVSSGATSSSLAKQYPASLFLATFSDKDQARAAAKFAWQHGKHQAMVIDDHSMSFARTVATSFANQFKQLGGSVLSQWSVNQKTNWAKVLLAHQTNIKSVDVVYLALGPSQAIPAIRALRKAKWTQMLIGPDSFAVSGMTAPNNAKAVKDVFYSSHAYFGNGATSRALAFAKAYQQQYKTKPTAFAGLGYDSVYLIAQAIRSAGNATANGIRQGLHAIHQYKGVTGTLGFLPGKNQVQKAVNLLTVNNGQLKRVGQIESS